MFFRTIGSKWLSPAILCQTTLATKRREFSEFEVNVLRREIFRSPDWIKFCNALRRYQLHLLECILHTIKNEVGVF